MKNGFSSALMSPAYFPPVSYFCALLKFDSIVIEQHETYPKQTYRNRCEILTANGKLSLTVPVTKPSGNNTRTHEVQVLYREKWQLNHQRAIASAYLSSPFYLYYIDELQSVFQHQEQGLLELDLKITRLLLELIGIKKEIELSSTYIHRPEGLLDLRTAISPKKPLDSQLFPAYTQVFSDRYGFRQDLSILDLLFNHGPGTLEYLEKLNIEFSQPA